MVFRKVYIVLCAALLAAGDLCAQQVRVEPRIAGLEGNRALRMGLINKSFDGFERQLVTDGSQARCPGEIGCGDVFEG